MKTLSFENRSGRPLTFIVEAWATEEIIQNGSTFTVHYPPPQDREDASHVEIRDDALVFWCEGSSYDMEIDGVVVW